MGGEGEGKKMGHYTGRVGDEYEDYAPTHPLSETAATSSDLEPEIPFVFGPRYAGLSPRSRG